MLINMRVSHAADAKDQWRKCTNASGSTFPLESGLNDVARCNEEAHAAGKSNLEDDQVIYDRCIALLLSSFLDLLLSASFSRCRLLHLSFPLVRLVCLYRVPA